MLESIKKISNPLTIIAIFAGLAEVSGTVVLPFLKDDSQSLYVWFLMAFPTLLILLFFITLNFNYKVLYAPSDFKDEDNFLKLFGKPTPEERILKLNAEIGAEDISQKSEGVVEAKTDLRSCLEIPASSQAIQHEARHGDNNPSFVRAGEALIAFAEAA
jgi:hypothetical protein